MYAKPHRNWVKKGDTNASLAVTRCNGSIVNKDFSNRPNPESRSCSSTNDSMGTIRRTCSMLLVESTPRILCHPHESKHSRTKCIPATPAGVLLFLPDSDSKSVRNGPTAHSINAKCSALLCVANSSEPVYISEIMQPALHKLEG